MLKVEKININGWEAAIRGMRNAYESWERSDTEDYPDVSTFRYGDQSWEVICAPAIGDNDLQLMKNLIRRGADHSKFMRFLTVTADITAPMYWWKQYDTYKVGTVANSCSTMHCIAKHEFTLADFSGEDLGVHIDADDNDGEEVYQNLWEESLNETICHLNTARYNYMRSKNPELKKKYWNCMIKLLPECYNQKRTVLLNYQVLRNMYHARATHPLVEWHQFRAVMEKLQYSELITMTTGEEKKDV